MKILKLSFIISFIFIFNELLVYANDIQPGRETYSATLVADPIRLDGSLDEWGKYPKIIDPNFSVPKGTGSNGKYVQYEEYGSGTWTGPDDQSLAIQIVYDSAAIYLGVIVTDDYHGNQGNSAWNGDAIMLMVANKERDQILGLYNYALGGVDESLGEIIVMDERGPGGTSAVIKRDKTRNTTTYEIRIPASALQLNVPLKSGDKVGIGFAVVDGDTGASSGMGGWGGLGPHSVVFGKNPSQTALIAFSDIIVPVGMIAVSDGDYSLVNGSGGNQTVQMSSYAVDQFEVTKQLWDSVRVWGLNNGYDIPVGQSFGDEYHPVQYISWYDAVKWCNARSEMDGIKPSYYSDPDFSSVYRRGETNPFVQWHNGYRLPTSVEWEKVAKGGFLDKKFPSSKNTLDISDANYLESGLSGSKRVGSYPANPYGLYDLSGNVYEWVWDFFDGINPSETVDPRGPITGTTRTWRGGYWGSNKDDCAVNFKNYNHPFERHTAGGFRTAITLSELPRQSVEIIKQPSEVVSQQGESCEFFVVAKNAAYYLWTKNGFPLTGKTNSILSLTNVQPSAIGDYRVVVGNSASSVTSSVASLNIKGVDSGIWKGLVAWHKFDGSFTNLVVIYNPNSRGFERSGDRNGLSSEAAVLGQGYTILDDSASINEVDRELSISVWIKISGYQGDNARRTIIRRMLQSGGGGYVFSFIESGVLNFSNRNDGGPEAFGLTPIPLNRWVSVSVVYDGSVVCFYVDGKLDRKIQYSASPIAYNKSIPLTIGALSANTPLEIFSGMIDDVRLYNRALSDTEVKALYDYESSPPVPTVTLAPVATSVVAGQTLTLTAGIAGANLAYRWQKDGVDLQASTRISGVTSQTLTVQGVVASDAGSYRLTATNLTGSATTTAAVVTVLVPVSLTQQPQSVVGVEGDTVQLSVTATGSPSPTYQWFKDGSAVPGGTNAALTLANVRPAMIGDYTAVVSNVAGSVTSSVASLSIKGVDSGIWKGLVAYYPFNGNALNGSLNNNMAVLNGTVYSIDRFGFRGFAVGFPSDQRGYIDLGKGAAPATIGDLTQSIWVKSDQALESISNDPGRVGLTKHIVIISRFTKGDSGGWPTVEINQKGNLSTELTAPFVGGAFSESSSKIVLDGRWHLLTAVKSGNLYLMYLDGILKSSVTDSQQPSNDANNSPLWIGANYWNDYDPNGTANYRGSIDDVRIYNRALSDTEVKALYDYESTPPVPTVTLAPVATSVVAGQTLTLTAGIAGANLAYQWQKDGVDLQASTRVAGVTSQTLTVQGVLASDAGSYRLTASNLTGSATTPAAVVTVLVPVSLTQQPQSVVGVEGDTVQLSVTATGSPTPTYQWLKNGKTIAGGNQPTLSLANFAEADAGAYSVVVSNAVNAVTSTEALVTYQAAIKILANGNPVTGMVRTLNPLSIELSFAKSDWILFYTLDGSEPNFLSTPYQEAFTVAEPASLRVVAYDGLYQNSYLGNPLSIRFLKPQTIDWGDPGAVRFGDTVTLKVASSSGLPVSVSVVSGPATLTGNALKATGTGEVVLQALQSGTDDFAPVNAQRTITVSPARQTLTWPVLADQKFGNPAVGVPVTAQSGLPVVLTVASGKASVNGTNVTLSGAGEVVLRAEQSGNANYEAISEVRSFKVAKAEQTLTVPTIANRTFNPQPFTPSAVVSSGLPVKFTVLSGPAVIEQGAVKLTGVGSVLLRAEQPGNDDYEATLPVDKTFVVSKGDQTLTFDAVGGRTFGDPVVMLTAKSSSGLSVSYRVVSGPGTIAGGSLTLTGAGTVLVQAVQAGDANYNPAAANQSIVVAKAAQSITFPALANVGYSTNATVLNATSSSGLAMAYRVIQGPATLSGSALSLSGVGAVSVAADQAGDGNYLPAISVTNAFTVARGDQTIAFTAIGDQVLGNAPITLKGTSSAGLPVIFQLVSGPATVSSGALTLLGEGTVTVRARQLGSPLYNPAQTDQSFVIRKLTTLAVTVAGNQGGTVAVTPLKDLYAPADTVTLTATASSGFAFTSWSGDLTGSANPATLAMSASRSVTASFKDIQAPALTWDLPAAGTTGVEQVRLSGQVTDNVGVTTAQWSREGGAGLALAVQANGSFAVDNLTLTVGTNRFAVVARDAAGNETKLERQVVWVPQRILTVGNASQVQEGQRLVFPVTLTSSGDVAGLTFELKYDPTYLTDPQLEWAGAVGQSVNNVNQATAGEITATFSMAGSPLPTGSQSLATVSFRGRSVPMAMSVDLSPRWISASSSTGALLSNGNAVEAGSGRITTRRIKGDNNANQRLDIGDAVLISRLQVNLEEVRTWDVSLNDLNASGAIDNGDVVKALRTVVGLDPQPTPGSEVKRLSNAQGLAKVLVNTNDAMAIELLDGPKATVGQPYRVAVKLNRVKGSLSGLSFALKYPTSLTLTDKQVGALVPGDALPFWNESAGQISLAAIRSTAWANATGVAAVLTFVPSAGFSAQAEWPLKLELVEITGSGFDVRPVDPVAVVIQSGGGTVNTPPQIALQPPAADGSLTLEIRAAAGATVAIEATGDLNTWIESQSITGQGDSTPVKVTLNPDPTVQAKFWRVRVR